MDRHDDILDRTLGHGQQPVSWRELVADLRRDRYKKFLRLSRKMVNHLVSIGLDQAQAMLEEIEGAYNDDGTWRESNVPGTRISLEDSLLMSDAPFDLPSQYLSDDEFHLQVLIKIINGKHSALL